MEKVRNERIPVEGFLPGDLIREELEERGWTQDDLAEILGRTIVSINEVITGKRGITVETARGLGEAFGTSAQFWLNMESAYRLSIQRTGPTSVSRKAALYGIAPVRLMIKRGWIEASTNVDVLEQRLREFFGTTDLTHMPRVAHAARKSTTELTPEQNAWLFRAKNLSKSVYTSPYTKTSLNTVLTQLKAILANETEIRLVPKILADGGIKLMIIEPFPRSKMDGINFWIDSSPVIALSLRYDRIDWFWHTLMHEIGHIKNEDGLRAKRVIVDTDLFDEDGDRPYEKEADDFAVHFLVPQGELDNFVARTQPLYSKSKIVGFAKRIGVHPGIIVGQLQHSSRGELKYSQHREMLVKVRDIIMATALTDGWGHSLPTNA